MGCGWRPTRLRWDGRRERRVDRRARHPATGRARWSRARGSTPGGRAEHRDQRTDPGDVRGDPSDGPSPTRAPGVASGAVTGGASRARCPAPGSRASRRARTDGGRAGSALGERDRRRAGPDLVAAPAAGPPGTAGPHRRRPRARRRRVEASRSRWTPISWSRTRSRGWSSSPGTWWPDTTTPPSTRTAWRCTSTTRGTS